MFWCELMVIWKGWSETVPCRATLNTPFPALCPRILGTRFTIYGLRMFWCELMVIWKGWSETVPCRATLNTPFPALCPRILGTRFTNYGLRVSGYSAYAHCLRWYTSVATGTLCDSRGACRMKTQKCWKTSRWLRAYFISQIAQFISQEALKGDLLKGFALKISLDKSICSALFKQLPQGKRCLDSTGACLDDIARWKPPFWDVGV